MRPSTYIEKQEKSLKRQLKALQGIVDYYLSVEDVIHWEMNSQKHKYLNTNAHTKEI